MKEFYLQQPYEIDHKNCNDFIISLVAYSTLTCSFLHYIKLLKWWCSKLGKRKINKIIFIILWEQYWQHKLLHLKALKYFQNISHIAKLCIHLIVLINMHDIRCKKRWWKCLWQTLLVWSDEANNSLLAICSIERLILFNLRFNGGNYSTGK